MEVLLARQGDYAMWGPGIDHHWSADEESVVLTVRWPSLASREGTAAPGADAGAGSDRTSG
jgi:hypothetical protein